MANAVIPQEIFRTYDIRGIVGETLTAEGVYQIALAIAAEALSLRQSRIIIARDGRLSGAVLSQALADGLQAGGCDVLDIGAVPTPLLYFATQLLASEGMRSGVMLTGSHNPANYNGLKIVLDGHTLAEAGIQGLYQRIQAGVSEAVLKGEYQSTDNIIEKYIARITSDIKLKRPLKIIVDAGNGIAGKVAPALYQKLGCEVIELFCEVDGHFPNHHPDPSVPENLKDLIEAVKKHKADIGLAFDGDGDRLGVVSDQGEVLWPDRQLMLYARDVLTRHPGGVIIYDVKCTRHLDAVIKKAGGVPLMWKTGHSLIKQKMPEVHALLGGEMSGHVFFKERWYGFDDGLYTGARLLEIIAGQSESANKVFKALPDSVNTPELKLAVNNAQREKILSEMLLAPEFTGENIITMDGVRVEFADGWGLIRGSNTTPHLILRFEADTEETLAHIQNLFKQALLRIDKDVICAF